MLPPRALPVEAAARGAEGREKDDRGETEELWSRGKNESDAAQCPTPRRSSLASLAKIVVYSAQRLSTIR